MLYNTKNTHHTKITRYTVWLVFAITTSCSLDISLFAQVRLLNHIQHNLPSFWLRYNDTVVKAVISVTFDLLTLNCAPGSAGPIYFLSLLDPRAIWFRKWMVREVSLSLSISLKIIISVRFHHYIICCAYTRSWLLCVFAGAYIIICSAIVSNTHALI